MWTHSRALTVPISALSKVRQTPSQALENMKKKISVILFAFILCLSIVFPAFAAETDGFADEYYRVIDMSNLLTDNEETALNAKLDEISIRQDMDIVVVTVSDLEGYTVQNYADDIYDECSFGYGASRDGLLLLISTADNDWYISTCGYGIMAFTDAGIQYIGKQMKPDLSAGDFASAFDTYASLCDEFITQARTDRPYDKSNLPREPLSLVWIPASVAIGFALAMIIVGQMKGKMKTVRSQAAANCYIKNGSMNITESRDMFLYSNRQIIMRSDIKLPQPFASWSNSL